MELEPGPAVTVATGRSGGDGGGVGGTSVPREDEHGVRVGQDLSVMFPQRRLHSSSPQTYSGKMSWQTR